MPKKVTHESRVAAKDSQKQKNAESLRKRRVLYDEYKKIEDSVAFKDLMKRFELQVAWHTKVSKDGVGYRKVPVGGGQFKDEVFDLSPEKRLSELDRAAGLEEGLQYIENMLTEPKMPEDESTED